MSWSLDWFSAAELAQAGQRVRRAGWTDRWLSYAEGLWWTVPASGERHVVTAAEFDDGEFLARDWTTEAVNANQCGATPAYNTTPIVYRSWTDEPLFVPPPAPGFADEDEEDEG